MTFAKFWERVQNFVPGTAPDLKMPDNKVADLDWDNYLEGCPGDQLHVNVVAEGDRNMKWDCMLPHEKWKDLDDSQLKSAIRNIGDPHSEMKKEMIAEARRRWFVSTDPSLLDGPRSPWLDFFDELDPRSIDEKFQELLKELK